MTRITVTVTVSSDDTHCLLDHLAALPSATVDRATIGVDVKSRAGGYRALDDFLLGSIAPPGRYDRPGAPAYGERARQDVARLVHQRRIDAETEARLLDLIGDCERLVR